MDRIIEEYGEEARQLSWQALAFEAGSARYRAPFRTNGAPRAGY